VTLSAPSRERTHPSDADQLFGNLPHADIMHLEAELGASAQPLDHLLKPVNRDRGLTLGHEQVR
jgi:hypothetical protein